MKKYMFDDTLKIAADYDFVLKCYTKGHLFKFLDLPMANYLEDGISQNNNTLSCIEALYIQTRYTKDTKDIYQNSIYKGFLSHSENNNFLFHTLHNKLYKKLNEKLENKKFVLYGFGNLGEIIYHKYTQNILAIIDKNYEELILKHNNINIHGPNELSHLNFDYIFISALGYEDIIKKELKHTFGINNNKILTVSI